MKKKSRESLEAVTHTHTHNPFMEKKQSRGGIRLLDRDAFYTNRKEDNRINKTRVGEDSALKSIYIKGKENIMLEN